MSSAAEEARGRPRVGYLQRVLHPGRALNVALSLILLGVALTPFLSPSQRDLFPNDETRYSEIVREMSTQHSLLVLTLDGQTYSHKPPLHFWMLYFFTRIFGEQSVWPYALPSLLGYLLALIVVRALALRMFGRGAITAMFVFSTFYFVWGASQIARMDAGFAALIALGMLFVWNFLETEDSRQLVFGSLAIGLAILTKGPMALVIALTTLLFEWARRRRLPRGGYVTALAVALAIPVLWLLPASVVGGTHYLRELVIDQNVGRMVEAFDHQKPFWYYAVRFPIIFFPWAPLIVMAAIAFWRRHLTELGNGAGFCLSWILAVVVPFSLISGKLEIYMLPAFVPSAILLGGFLTTSLRSCCARGANVTNRAVVVFLALLFGAIAVLPPDVITNPLGRSVARLPEVRLWLWSTALFALAILFAQLTIARRKVLTTAVLAGIAAMFPLIFVTLRLGPVVNSLHTTSALVRALSRQNVQWSDIVLVESPYLWSRDLGAELIQVVHVDDERNFPSSKRPRVLVTEEDHEREHDRFARILQGYTKVDSVFVRGRRFGIYRLGS